MTTVPFSKAERDALFEIADHLNANHPDTVALIARYGLNDWSIEQAQLRRFEPGAVIVGLAPSDGARFERSIALPGHATCGDEVQPLLMGLLSSARQAAADTYPITSLEHELATLSQLGSYRARVSEARWLNRNVRALTLSGDFSALNRPGYDAFVFVMVPGPGTEPLPESFTMNHWRSWNGPDKPLGAYYTLRRAGPTELELWFVVHGDGPSVGHWAGRADIGDELVLWGARRAYAPPEGTERLLLIGDESAQPALAAILERDGQQLPADLWLEAPSQSQKLPMPEQHAKSARWVFRRYAPGADDSLVHTVKTEVPTAHSGLYVFGAGEAQQVRALRRYFRKDLGMTAAQVHLTGYWKR